MSDIVKIGRKSIGCKTYIQDMKINQFTQNIEILVPMGHGLQWFSMTEQFAREIGFINPEAILKIPNINQ